MKSNLGFACGRKRSRIGVLSLLTVMVLLFTTGVSTAAGEKKFELFHEDKFNSEGLMEPLKVPSDEVVDSYVSLLVDKADEFVEKTASEPRAYFEGLKATFIKQIEDIKKEDADAETETIDKKAKEARDEVLKRLKDIDEEQFGGKERKEKLIALAEELSKKGTVEELEAKDLFKKLLGGEDNEEARKVLKLATAQGKKRQGDPLADVRQLLKGFLGGLGEKVNSVADTVKGMAEVAARNQAILSTPLPTATPTPTPTPTTPEPRTSATAPPPATGEANLAALQKYIQPICELKKRLLDDQDARQRSKLDEISRVLSELASTSRVGNPQQKERQSPEEIFFPLLKNLADGNKKPLEIPPPAAPQVASRQQQPAPEKPIQLPQLPPPQEPPPPAGLGYVPSPSNVVPRTPSVKQVPNMSASTEKRLADNQIKKNGWTNLGIEYLNVNSKPEELFGKLGTISQNMAETQAAIQTAKNKAADIEDKLEAFSNGAEPTADTENYIASLEQDVNTKKSNVENARAKLTAAANQGPEALADAQSKLDGAQQELTTAQNLLSTTQSRTKGLTKEENAKAAALNKEKERLNTYVATLEGQLGKMKGEESTIKSIIAEKDRKIQADTEKAIAAITAQAGGGAGGRTSNARNIIDRIGGGGGQTAPSRQPGPQYSRTGNGQTGRPTLGAQQ